jgi:cell division protein FtsA
MTHKSNPSQSFVTAIDLGSSHCTTLIAGNNAQTGEPKIVGIGVVPSRGIKRATIINLEEATDTIERSLAEAEKVCGHNVDSVYVNVSGKHIASQNSSGEVTVADPNNEITEQDVDRTIELARTISLPADREVLNLTPCSYTVDDQEEIRDPIGMIGSKLKTEVHLITCSSSALRNLEKAVNNIDNLSVEAFVFSGYASSEVVLTEDEKEAGAICVDIGADTTSYCVYTGGAIKLSGVVPIGGRYVTQDINAYIHVGLENAEKIKLSLSENNTEIAPKKPEESREEYRRRLRLHDVLNLADYDPNLKARTIYKSTLINTVIAPRLKQIFELIDADLKNHKYCGELGSGAIVVGGAAKTAGLPEIASETLKMQVRVGTPKVIPGAIRHLDDSSFAVALGVLDYGLRAAMAGGDKGAQKENKQSLFGEFISNFGQVFKKIMP